MKLWMIEVVVTTGAIRRAKTPVKSSPPTNQNPNVLQAGCHSCCPTNSIAHWREKYHISWTCSPQAHLGVFQPCLWPLKAPDYLGGGLPCLLTALWCQYPKVYNYLFNASWCYSWLLILSYLTLPYVWDRQLFGLPSAENICSLIQCKFQL